MKIQILAISLLATLSVFGQTTEAEASLQKQNTDTTQGWKKGGVISVNLSQVALSNWAAGGQNSISLNGLLSVYANYKKGKSTWDNSLDLGYGILYQGETLTKTDDKIILNSKFGYGLNKSVFLAGLLDFRTQMAHGYNSPNDSDRISAFMAPGYLLGAIGIDWKPHKSFSAFISPITVKSTFVMDQALADAGAFGVEGATVDNVGNIITEGKRYRGEFGGYLKLSYQKDIMKNVSLGTKLGLFSNYLENPQNIDVNWETLLSMKVNKWLSATLSINLIYDHDITIQEDSNGDGIIDSSGPRTQFMEVLGIGFSYKF